MITGMLIHTPQFENPVYQKSAGSMCSSLLAALVTEQAGPSMKAQ
jgi:hypothetical protein